MRDDSDFVDRFLEKKPRYLIFAAAGKMTRKRVSDLVTVPSQTDRSCARSTKVRSRMIIRWSSESSLTPSNGQTRNGRPSRYCSYSAQT